MELFISLHVSVNAIYRFLMKKKLPRVFGLISKRTAADCSNPPSASQCNFSCLCRNYVSHFRTPKKQSDGWCGWCHGNPSRCARTAKLQTKKKVMLALMERNAGCQNEAMTSLLFICLSEGTSCPRATAPSHKPFWRLPTTACISFLLKCIYISLVTLQFCMQNSIWWNQWISLYMKLLLLFLLLLY